MRSWRLAIIGQRQKARAILLGGIVLFLLWFLGHTIFVIWIGLSSDVKKADVAIVLGNKVNEDGMPSPRLQSRLDRAVNLYHQGIVKKIIVSGGQGIEGYEEAEIMRIVLVQSGIPESNIILDKQGYDTFQTAQNSKFIMEAHGFRTAIIVTHYYHIARTKLALEKFGIEPVYAAYAETEPDIREPYTLIREFVAYYYYLFRSYPET